MKIGNIIYWTADNLDAHTFIFALKILNSNLAKNSRVKQKLLS